MSYGCAPASYEWDRFEFHNYTAAAAMMLVGIGWLTYYKRDTMRKNWARREAHLVIQEREAAGVPYIDRNFVDPAKLDLPTDEELDGAEVII